MKKNQKYIANPPGATIKEQIEMLGMNQKELAARMGMSEKHISKLINGDVQLTVEMAKNGWVVDVTKKSDQVIHLRKYFEKAQLKYLQTSLVPRIAYKKVDGNKKDEYALIAWAQKAKLEARKMETKRFNVEKVTSSILLIRQIQNLEKLSLR